MLKKFFALSLLACLAAGAQAKTLAVVASTEDMAALTREVGGDKVEVTAIARGYQDPHFVDAKPSYLLALRKADLLVAVGLELEVGWLPALVQQSRNPKILKPEGYLDASQGCQILEKKASVSRSEGDVHPFGNPHYWLDPENGKMIARNIALRLSSLSPENAAFFQQRHEDFARRLDAAMEGWKKRLAPWAGAKVVTYHRSWPNFAGRFGFEVADNVEPVPGVPPTPGHTLSLIGAIKAQGVRMIWVEPYFNLDVPNSVAQKSGARVLVLSPSVGGAEGVKDYFSLFDHNIGLIEKAMKEGK